MLSGENEFEIINRKKDFEENMSRFQLALFDVQLWVLYMWERQLKGELSNWGHIKMANILQMYSTIYFL